MQSLLSISALAQADALAQNKISSEQLIAAHLDHIHAINPLINAIVQTNADAALKAAYESDVRRAQGKLLSKLDGIPFTVKDVFDSSDMRSAAAIIERANHVPLQDAVTVARMKAAGCILIGRTNCPPGGGGIHTANALYGNTHNPYQLALSPGGSSGGEAAAIASCMSPLGLGSDSGGSIRLPAHFCGIAAIKPTAGRVPATGLFDHPGGLFDPRSQAGPMARFVCDLLPALEIISGTDWQDSGVIDRPTSDFSETTSLRDLRIAYYPSMPQAPSDADTQHMIKHVIDTIACTGAQITEHFPPCLTMSHDITMRYFKFVTKQSVDTVQLFRDWDKFRTHMLQFLVDYDAIICPVDYQPAFNTAQADPKRYMYTLPYSLTGWPAVVVRAATSYDQLPIGVQIIARPWKEVTALHIAQHIETTIGGWKMPSIA